MITDLSTTYLGLDLPTPIIAASSGLTNSIEQIKELEKNGAGAIVLKSLFEEEIIADLDRNINRLHSENYLYPETIEFYEKDNVEDTLTNYLKLIFEAKKQINIPIIASINCVTAHNWPYFTKYLQQAGADAIELNIFILPADINQNGAEYENATLQIAKAVINEATIPVSVKISPYFSGLANMVMELSKTKVKGVVLFNRFFSPDYDMENLEIIPASIYSNKDEYINPLRWIALTAGKTDCDLVATTGIHNGQTVAKMILAGATATQVASSLYINGIGHIKTIKEELTNWMKSKNFETIPQFKGMLSQTNTDNPAGLLRVQFMKHFAGK